jgi:hypothetical protein
VVFYEQDEGCVLIYFLIFKIDGENNIIMGKKFNPGMALMFGISQREMMKYSFVFGLICLAFGPATNAFRQSFGRRRLAQKSSFLQTKEFSVKRSNHVTIRYPIALTDGRRLTSQPHHRHGYTKRCSSSIDQQDLEVDDRVAANEDEDATFRNEIEIEKFFSEAERDANRINFPRGKPEGHYVTNQYSVPQTGFENLVAATADGDSNGEGRAKGITQEEVDRLEISGTNITLPIALMLLDGEVYPSLSRARKACR